MDSSVGGSSGSGGGVGSTLPVGVWTNLTPNGALAGTGVYHLALDPSAPATIYLATDRAGMWKTTDGGRSWARLGNPNGVFTASNTDYLDDPCQVQVDPRDPKHLYATEGVDGSRQGFWISRDGGATWTKPQGFLDVAKKVGGAGAFDVVMMSVDPIDFDHVIISPHNDWAITAGYSSGIYETRDGGQTWTAHMPPGDAWAAGTKGVHILHHPRTMQGNGDTWLVTDEGAGFWRTADAGKSWVKVSDAKSPHGGNQSYYSATGALYVGAKGRPMRSSDNGMTWKSLDGLPYAGEYSAFLGTGSLLYAHGSESSCTKAFKFRTSPETDGTTWTEDSAQGAPPASPWEMRFDATNKILYTANRCGGFWALRVAN